MKATVYTKPNCPYCVRAKAILEKRGVEYVEISAVENRERLIEEVIKATGAAPRTVPQIWLGEQYIGGHDQLVIHYEKEDAND